jgi:hypothetical protein
MFSTLLQHVQDLSLTYPIMVGFMAEIETYLKTGKMDLPISLVFAANKGDDMLLHQLLKKGSDPNEIDHKTGKTPLVRILRPIISIHIFFYTLNTNYNSTFTCYIACCSFSRQ